jgi:hypothetical protein
VFKRRPDADAQQVQLPATGLVEETKQPERLPQDYFKGLTGVLYASVLGGTAELEEMEIYANSLYLAVSRSIGSRRAFRERSNVVLPQYLQSFDTPSTYMIATEGVEAFGPVSALVRWPGLPEPIRVEIVYSESDGQVQNLLQCVSQELESIVKQDPDYDVIATEVLRCKNDPRPRDPVRVERLPEVDDIFAVNNLFLFHEGELLPSNATLPKVDWAALPQPVLQFVRRAPQVHSSSILPALSPVASSSELPSLEGLLDEGYDMSPPIETLETMSSSELAEVRDFAVARRGHGMIHWLEPVDVRGLDLDRIVHIEDTHVYTFQSRSATAALGDAPARISEPLPPVGTGLNKRVRIVVENVYPSPGETDHEFQIQLRRSFAAADITVRSYSSRSSGRLELLCNSLDTFAAPLLVRR